MKRSTAYGITALFALWAGAATASAQTTNAATTTTVTNVTGTIAQLNYDNDGEVQGFLIGTNVLLSFPGNICGGIGALGVVGNSVTYSGSAVTATSGFESVQVTSFTNNSTKASYTPPTNTSTTYGPTAGTVKQANYAGDGSIDGFLFAPTGSAALIFVSTGERASSTLSTYIKAAATVSVTGTTTPSMSACSTTATLEAVDASSLTFGTQTIIIAGGGNPGGSAPGGPGPGPGGPGGHH